jgi:hypothetical protein
MENTEPKRNPVESLLRIQNLYEELGNPPTEEELETMHQEAQNAGRQ